LTVDHPPAPAAPTTPLPDSYAATSDEFPPPDRARVWREMSQSLGDFEFANAQDVSWRVEGWRLRSIAFGYSRWSGGDYQFGRTPERIARDGLDMIRVMRCVEGAIWWRVEEREFAQRPGDIVVTDFSRPEEMRARDSTNLVLILPRAELLAAERNLDHLHGLMLRPGTATQAALAAHVDALWRSCPSMTAEETQPVAAATLALVSELLVKPTPGRWEPNRQNGATNARMLRYVREHLSDPTLGPDALCQRFGVSRAVLYRAFEPLGGVSAYIRSLRLRRAYVELSRDAPPPLGRLAASLGFASLDTFRDAFRRKYRFAPGRTPTSRPPRPPEPNLAYMTLPSWVPSINGL
jgi:AraC-like DNA-binding protein